MAGSGSANEVWIVQRCGPQHHPPHAQRQPAVDLLSRPDSTAELHMAWKGRDNRLNRGLIDPVTGKCPVQIDDMQPAGPSLGEEACLRGGVVAVNRRPVHVTFGQANDLTVLQVNGGENDHGIHSRKARRKFRPTVWLFSGWNCTPRMLSRPMIAATSLP